MKFLNNCSKGQERRSVGPALATSSVGEAGAARKYLLGEGRGRRGTKKMCACKVISQKRLHQHASWLMRETARVPAAHLAVCFLSSWAQVGGHEGVDG